MAKIKFGKSTNIKSAQVETTKAPVYTVDIPNLSPVFPIKSEIEYIDREVQVEKIVHTIEYKTIEVPVEVIKEVDVIKYIEVPVQVIKEIPVEKIVYVDREIEKPISITKYIENDKLMKKLSDTEKSLRYCKIIIGILLTLVIAGVARG